MLSINQVAEKLNLTPRTVYRYVKDGKLKAVKLGYIWRIREEDFEEFIRPKGGETNENDCLCKRHQNPN